MTAFRKLAPLFIVIAIAAVTVAVLIARNPGETGGPARVQQSVESAR